MMITTDTELAAYCERLKQYPSFALDMEFQRERTYFARLYLIQIASPGEQEDELTLIDPLAARELKPLFQLVADPGLQKVVHAGSQDMEIVYQMSGLLPRNVFDTQIGAALIGYGDQPGYATLVEKIANVRLSKLETITDWSRRPLTPGQIQYALDDVRYLHELRDAITRKLDLMGRIEWAREEMEHYGERGNYERDPSRLYLRIGRIRSLNRRGLAILRALAAWREDEAMRRDEPRGRVVPDEILVEAARRAPTKVSDLQILRGLHPSELKRSGDAMVKVVADALKIPESDWPEMPVIRGEDPEMSLTVDLLEVFLRARARESEIAPSYLGSRHDLAHLVDEIRGETSSRNGQPLLLTGWRRDMVGEDLIAIAAGRVNLHVDPETGRVTTSRR